LRGLGHAIINFDVSVQRCEKVLFGNNPLLKKSPKAGRHLSLMGREGFLVAADILILMKRFIWRPSGEMPECDTPKDCSNIIPNRH
jgi:hypothetical protein